MENLATEIGKRLTELRKRSNKTQQEVSDEILGLTPQHLSSYEKGYQKPGIEKLIIFSKFYNVSLDYLCFGKASDSKDIKLDTYEDLIKILLLLKKTNLVNFSFVENEENISSLPILKAEIKDYDVIDFFIDLQKFESVEKLIDETLYNKIIENLISKYKDDPLKY